MTTIPASILDDLIRAKAHRRRLARGRLLGTADKAPLDQAIQRDDLATEAFRRAFEAAVEAQVAGGEG